MTVPWYKGLDPETRLGWVNQTQAKLAATTPPGYGVVRTDTNTLEVQPIPQGEGDDWSPITTQLTVHLGWFVDQPPFTWLMGHVETDAEWELLRTIAEAVKA